MARASNILQILTIAVLAGGLWQCTEVADDSRIHPEEWAEPGALFHGEKVRASGIETCKSCHGEDFLGGSSGVACSDCHKGGGASPHPALLDFINPSHESYHGRIFWDNGYDLSACQACHGGDLDGGTVGYSCSNSGCHTSNEGVFACDNCHAGPESTVFKDLRNQSDVALPTVGTHQAHLSLARGLTTNVSCASCHIIPETYAAATHLDTLTPDLAEVAFGKPATFPDTLNLDTLGFNLNWDRLTGQCSDVYCHGSFVHNSVTGNDSTWTWTTAVDGPLCGTCHGLPPEAPHLATGITTCGTCHKGVADPDTNLIIDPALHMNGAVNVW